MLLLYQLTILIKVFFFTLVLGILKQLDYLFS